MQTQTRRFPAIATIVLAAIMAIIILSGPAAMADTFSWNAAGSGDWDAPVNWTPDAGNTSLRIYPNDATDIAILGNVLGSDATITLPAGGVTVNIIEIGDADNRYVLSGGTLTTTTNRPFRLLNSGTAQLDAPWIDTATNTKMQNSGTFIVNNTITGGAGGVFGFINAAVRMNVPFGSSSKNLEFELGSSLEIGSIVSLNAIQVRIRSGSSIRAADANRSISDDVLIDQSVSTGGTFFRGPYDLEITGPVTFIGRSAVDRSHVLDGGRLIWAGNVTWALSNSRDDDAANYYEKPDRIDLINGGILEITGNSLSTYTDSTGDGVHIGGTGTFLVNNVAGSATGSGNKLWIGPSATLGGNGSTSGSELFLGGTVAPGDSVGTLTVGTTTFESGSRYEWEFDGENTDLLMVVGDLIVDDNFTLDLVQLRSRPTGTVDLISFAGDFFGDPSAWNIILPDPSWSYGDIFATSTTGGGILQITGLVPEPSSALLLALADLVLRRRRRRS